MLYRYGGYTSGSTTSTSSNGGCPYCGCNCGGGTTTCGDYWPAGNVIVVNYVCEQREEPKIYVWPDWWLEQRQRLARPRVVAYLPAPQRAFRRRPLRPGFTRKPTAAHRLGLRRAAA